MARSFVIGGTSATGVATGVPYIRRIVRRGSSATGFRRADGFSAIVSGHNARTQDVTSVKFGVDDGIENPIFFPAFNEGTLTRHNDFGNDYVFEDGSIAAQNSAQMSRAWNVDLGKPAGNNWHWLADFGFPGEMLMVEFPSTSRTFSVHFEAENYSLAEAELGPAQRHHRVRVMLTAPGQRVDVLDAYGNPLLDGNGNRVSKFMSPIRNNNFVEISQGETATFNAKTKHFFMFIATHDTNNLFDDTLSGELEGLDPVRSGMDAVSLLVTAVLDHDGIGNGRGTATKVIGADGQEKEPIKKIYPQSVNNTEGVG